MRLLTTQDVLHFAVFGPCTFPCTVRYCMPCDDSPREDSLDSRSMATMRVLQDMPGPKPDDKVYSETLDAVKLSFTGVRALHSRDGFLV